jgi:CDP-alcohol phosphatidyltransferase
VTTSSEAYLAQSWRTATVQSVRTSFAGRRPSGNLLFDHLFRPVSFAATVPFLRLGWTPNQVTCLAGVSGVGALILFALGNTTTLVAGGIFYFVAILLDHVDGNVARMQDTASYLGKFIDGVKDKAVMGLLPFALAVGLAWQGGALPAFTGDIWLAVGGVAGLLYLIEETTLTRYGRFIRQVRLDGHDPGAYVPPPRTGMRRILRGLSLRGLKHGLVWRRTLSVLLPFTVIAAGRADLGLLILAAFNLVICPLAIADAIRRAYWTIDIHRRSKNHVEC